MDTFQTFLPEKTPDTEDGGRVPGWAASPADLDARRARRLPETTEHVWESRNVLI